MYIQYAMHIHIFSQIYNLRHKFCFRISPVLEDLFINYPRIQFFEPSPDFFVTSVFLSGQEPEFELTASGTLDVKWQDIKNHKKSEGKS